MIARAQIRRLLRGLGIETGPLSSLDRDRVQATIHFLRGYLGDHVREQIRDAIAADGDDWLQDHQDGWGRRIRAALAEAGYGEAFLGAPLLEIYQELLEAAAADTEFPVDAHTLRGTAWILFELAEISHLSREPDVWRCHQCEAIAARARMLLQHASALDPDSPPKTLPARTPETD